MSADVANIWVTGLRYLLAHPSVIGGAGLAGGGGVLSEGVGMEGSLGGKMRSEWLVAEFSLVDEDGYGIVSEDVAVATICKLCPGIKEAKVRRTREYREVDVWLWREELKGMCVFCVTCVSLWVTLISLLQQDNAALIKRVCFMMNGA